MKNSIFILAALLTFVIFPVSAASFQMTGLKEIDSSKCLYEYSIYVDTEGKDSNAADLIIKYNPNEVSIVDADKTKSGIQIETGKAYESYVYNKADNSSGEIKLTAVRFDFLNGKELFATIPFVAKVATPTFSIKFDGIGNTYDSNIAELTTSTDLLTSVSNPSINVSNYSCALNSSQVDEIQLPSKNSSVQSPNTVLVVTTTFLGTVLGLLLLLILLILILRKRIKVVNNSNKAINGALISFAKDQNIIESFVTNKRGYVWIPRKYLKLKAEITKDKFKTKTIPSGIRDSKKISLDSI